MLVLVGIETVVLVLLAILVTGLLRAYGTVLRRLDHLAGGVPADARQFSLVPAAGPAPERPGADAQFGPAHDVTGESPTGEVVSARVVAAEHDTVLLFLSSGCTSCATFWAELAEPDALSLPMGTRLLVIVQGLEAESPDEVAALAPPGLDVIMSTEAWRQYEVPGSPHVVFVEGASGRIRGEGTGQSLRQVAALLARSSGDATFVTGGSRPKNGRGAQEEAEVDRELLAAGILPGDPRLYGEPA